MPTPAGLKDFLERIGAKNKQYDADIDGVVDNADAVDGYHGADLEKVANKGVADGYPSLDANTQVVERLSYEGVANGVATLDADALVPLAQIPVLDYTKLQFPAVRQETLAKFTDPKILTITSSMLELLNSAEKVEAAAGNITANSQELTVVGGTATAAGNSWVYWNLPKAATKVYVRLLGLASSGNGRPMWRLMDCPGSTPMGDLSDYEYYLAINTAEVAADYRFHKIVGGTLTVLATADDLANLTYYDVEIYIDTQNEIEVYRDGILKFSLTPDSANIPEIEAIAFGCMDTTTTSAEYAKFKGSVVVIYE
jgi:hypothetical protein